jgi:YbbR domain-containing protein
MPTWQRVRIFLHGVFIENLYFKLIAASLVAILHIWVLGDRDVTVRIEAPVRIIVPKDMMLMSQPIDRVNVTVGGRWSELQRLGPSDLPPLTVELSEQRPDEIIRLSADQLRLPPGLRILALDPSSVHIRMERRTTKSVPVRPVILGTPAEGYRQGAVTVTPPQVELTGPKSALDRIRFALTDPIDITGKTQSIEERVELRYDSPLVQDDLQGPLKIRVAIETQEIEQTLRAIPVTAINTSYLTTITPRTVEVTVRGPKAIIESIPKDAIFATVDMSQQDSLPPGTYQKQPTIANLPPGVTLVRIYPTDFQLRTEARP